MNSSNIFNLFVICSLAFLLCSCAQSEAQQNFRDQALRPPSGIQAMTANGGAVQGGETDTDDWRIAPDFQGSIAVETAAFPNPVAFNSSFQILLSVQSFQSINGLQVYAFRQPGQLVGPLFSISGQLEPGFQTIRLSPQEFASSAGTGNFGSLYRIIFYDGRNSIITYGDIQVQ